METKSVKLSIRVIIFPGGLLNNNDFQRHGYFTLFKANMQGTQCDRLLVSSVADSIGGPVAQLVERPAGTCIGKVPFKSRFSRCTFPFPVTVETEQLFK